MQYFSIKKDILFLRGSINKTTVPDFYDMIISDLHGIHCARSLPITSIDCSELTEVDNAGVALLDEILFILGLDLKALKDISESNFMKVNIFTTISMPQPLPEKKNTFLYVFGDYFYQLTNRLYVMLILTSDIFYWSIMGLWNRKSNREGSFTLQSLLIGLNAIPIVGLLSFIIGLILSLQTAMQLKQFGADQFLANLLAISLVSEISPLITAIIVAGRSGSAIASEIATMKVTEELDALKMMALNPIRYVIVPKFHAITVCMSLLVMISILVGILGGLIVAVSVLDLSPIAFINTCIRVVSVRTFVISLIKSTVFAWQIVIIGSYYGLMVHGGAEGVGKATTQSVVASIFGVIIMDAMFSFIYLV